MNKRTLIAMAGSALVLALAFSYRTEPPIPYPRPFPDSIALRFLPGLISVEGLDFNAAFSPDGQSFYFSRSIDGQWDIFVSRNVADGWTIPVRVSFSDEKYSEADPVFSPDGKLFFISNRPRKEGKKRTDFDIWYVEESDEDGWSAPENVLLINSDSSEYYVSFSHKGNLYFGSSRPGGYGSHDIYVSHLEDSQYLPPQNLGSSINSPESEHDPCIFGNEEFIVFKSENRPDGFGQADLYCSRFDRLTGWSKAENLGALVNTIDYEYCPYITPDAKYFFYSSEGDIKWVDMRLVRERIDNMSR
jgi:hypothetical protein